MTLREQVAAMPPGALIPRDWLLDRLDDIPEPTPACIVTDDPPETWRTRLWTAPAETRLGRDELLEAVGRSASWLYRHTGPSATDRIPHRRLDGELVFIVGEVRRWLRDHEVVVRAGPMDGPSSPMVEVGQ